MAEEPRPGSAEAGKGAKRPRRGADRREPNDRVVTRLLIATGAGGLLLALFFGLWVSNLAVQRSVVVQVDTVWLPGERLAARTQVLDADLQELSEVHAELVLRHPDRGVVQRLGTLAPVDSTGIAQGVFDVPQTTVGRYVMQLHYRVGAHEFDEELPVEIVNARPSRLPTPTISTHSLQWGDDTDPQPQALRIALRPVGRVVAGFRTEFMARITHPDGSPWKGPVELVLHDGEYMGRRGQGGKAERLVRGETNHLGLIGMAGPLTSEVVRLGVRVVREGETLDVICERAFRFVSYAGAVAVDVDPIAASIGGLVDVHARGLGSDRPVFVDAFGPDGAWVDTFMPPVVGGEPPRSLRVPDLPGVLQFEAYHFTNSPRESAAVANLQVVRGSPDQATAMVGLVEAQRSLLSTPRVERDFDVEHETAFLRRAETIVRESPGQALDRRWLLGTLPVRVHGPPVALRTRPRDDADMAARKHFYKMSLRWFVLGGGMLFLVVLTALMLRAHARGAEATLRAAQDLELDEETLAEHVRQARRGALARGLGVIGVMAAALILTLLMLENLL